MLIVIHIKTSGKIKWYVQTHYVDIDTGEVLNRTAVKSKQYRIVTRTKNTEILHETARVITTTNGCRKTEYTQQTLI
jgi:hypothetical protein